MDLQELYDRLLRYCYSRTHDKYLAEDDNGGIILSCDRISDSCHQEKVKINLKAKNGVKPFLCDDRKPVVPRVWCPRRDSNARHLL